MNSPKVISLVVDQDLCTGCGVCVSECTSKSISMDWTEEGFLVPQQTEYPCLDEGDCISVCPFNPFPKEKVKTEDELSNIFLRTNYENDKIGKYESLYVGYSKADRPTSSSGGLATYYLGQLFERKIIDAAIVVNYQDKPSKFYDYSLIKDKNQLIASSKTRYYPVTLENAINELDNFKGKVAVVGVGCFIKAIRLKQYENPSFKDKVVFLLAIICGGLKSKMYTSFLSNKTLNGEYPIKNPEYRIKSSENKAIDYYFGLDYKKERHLLRMREVGDMWGTGFFKSNACDFCEDVTSELADVSLGDAWLEPYVNDGNGTSIIITRSLLADQIVKEGMVNDELFMEDLSVADIVKSQSGSFNHRHKGLGYRLKKRERQGKLSPPKRERNIMRISLPFKLVQYMRQSVRRKSIKYWMETHKAELFQKQMKFSLFLLRITTILYRKTR
ncbi:Coenzyme F420 hydrogenase/dehydrogenase, beta subunit C-terminal domain [Zobellia sp. B3R18]|uniref:Coenzyme F420 hydrogenase/dehydrogenase, beta subunit C-terminal domain n=1 Tax=Zobellia sp. B3R18 TaxID=2841568 RepID=UPI001C06670D|nr:Coenzyme F420 hydrogenase/dehydrogenase, beta subunit C-terminal domain [Zobellia sp. B3R18]MBU2974889.1 Coenzyme F420 hydrogenase/dehydrogenase, beta subunit C-terminal domain [Zobellia sp. B3R18]